MRSLFFIFFSLFSFFVVGQITTVQTLTYDSSGRSYVFQFPNDTTTYEKIIMEYSMRCKGGNISTQGAPNDIGCGEWDYSCNTFIQDSDKTDSVQAMHASYVISNFSGNDYPYVVYPTYSYYAYKQYKLILDSILSEDTTIIGAGNEDLTFPFATNYKKAKAQYLYTASELLSAGLTAGDISGLQFMISNAGEEAHFLRIRIKQTSQTQLNSSMPETEGFTEVYFLNTVLIDGINRFNFYHPFTWDGTSNLLVEISFTNSTEGVSSIVKGHNADSVMTLLNTGQDQFLEFSATGRVNISQSDYSSVADEVTVQFWAYGNPDALPAKTSAFEAVDLQNRRQVHAHLPWSNSNIYWDCGNTGSYDRIYKSATSDEIAGEWHHWAFTKNAQSGEMKIYLDGQLWHSGTGKTQPIDINKFYFGSNVAGSYPYYGDMDDFSVWDKALSQEEIHDWMYRKIDATHPEYTHLINYFMLNDTMGNEVADSSLYHVSGLYDGTASWKTYRGVELFKDFEESNFRPNIVFFQGSYQNSIDTIEVRDSTRNTPNMVVQYDVDGTDLKVVDTNYYYRSGAMPVFDETHAVVDSVLVESDDTLHITTLHYYKKYLSSFEIMSFVTPYGLHLDLGANGKTWRFDVTDFAPVLRGRKRLFLTGGTHQEDLDIRFLFKKGIPARNVVDIQQIWKAGNQRNYNDLLSDKYFEPRCLHLNSDASTFKIRMAVTGHGQEGEFIGRAHFINLNRGAKKFQWQVWKTCSDNPIYPQGGTWTYDRAGWCPGAPTTLKEFEITDYVTSDTLNVDYGITTASGDSRYLINAQLVSYSDPNFNLDVAIDEIQRPSNRIEFSRFNPVCYHPTVVIRNTGKTELTSCKITYYVKGSYVKTYQWSGNLKFDEKEAVALPIESPSFWIGDSSFVFIASVSEPNGETDEYAGNNTDSSIFVLPDMYDEPLLIYLRTNNNAYENSYVIKNHEGNIVFSHSGLSNSTLYKDTLDLPDGCYTLELYDSGNDGLSYWANSSQGSGYMYLKNLRTHQTYKKFQPDFGKFFNYSFIMGDVSYVNKPNMLFPEVEIYPNPTQQIFNVEISGDYMSDVTIGVYDLLGRKLIEKQYRNTTTVVVKFDMSDRETGLYLCRISVDGETFVRKIIVAK